MIILKTREAHDIVFGMKKLFVALILAFYNRLHIFIQKKINRLHQNLILGVTIYIFVTLIY